LLRRRLPSPCAVRTVPLNTVEHGLEDAKSAATPKLKLQRNRQQP
jgi:hypothetical protein